MERRLFPFKRPTNRLPTVDEILPKQQAVRQQRLPTSQTESKLKITRHLQQQGNKNDDPDNNNNDPIDDIGDADYSDEDFENSTNYANEQEIDPENLQSVESNHVDSYYSEGNEINNNEGRSTFFDFPFHLQFTKFNCLIFLLFLRFLFLFFPNNF